MANRYLLDRGWVAAERGLLSPDGKYRAQVVGARNKTVTAEAYALVYFEEVADEQEWIDAAE